MARNIGGLKINRQFELKCCTAGINPFTLLIHVLQPARLWPRHAQLEAVFLVVMRLDQRGGGARMPEYQPVSSPLIWAVERPRCPNCGRDRMLPSKFEASHHRFECQNCGRVEMMVVESDPMTSGALGWLAGELKPPT
ncbi:hypothetical protein KMZ68_14510 [Bradyrhizobium sediminis]|uniref:Uncharacterized protein n=1 Tax=Bradyrhizobium sediminis TaxID=2840469 RepID=A0A975NJD7_9BRAD|nr:hypothetical protein [Bradyrhizobium sediminis]QWG16248.1 hypothetical protein KMZ68_14510 [Bradyrhizobium sediminis]